MADSTVAVLIAVAAIAIISAGLWLMWDRKSPAIGWLLFIAAIALIAGNGFGGTL